MTSTTTGSFVMIKKKTTKYISGNDMKNIPCSIKVKIAKQRQTTKVLVISANKNVQM
jgi:ribosomal protein L31E